MTPRAWALVALLAAGLTGLSLTGRSIFASLSALFAGVLAVGFVWSRSSLRGLRLERSSRSLTSQVGKVFEESLTLRNSSRIPKLWVEVRDESDLPGAWASARAIGLSGPIPGADFTGHRASAIAVGLSPGRQWLWAARTICTLRGRFRLGPATLISADPFGLFPVSRPAGEVREVVVLPPTIGLPSFPIPSGRLPGGEALRRRTYQVTPNAAGVREYAPGDSLNRIHWRSTARRGRLISKEFELDPMADVWVLLDGHRRAHLRADGGEEPLAGAPGPPVRLPPNTEEYMIAAAAAVALYVLRKNRAVGLLGYGDSRWVVQPERGEAQLFRILEALAGFRAEGEADITDVFRIETPWFQRGASMVLVTPSVRDDLVSELLELRRTGLNPVVTLIDPSGFGSPLASARLAERLTESGIPVRVARRGSALENTLGRAPERRRPLAA